MSSGQFTYKTRSLIHFWGVIGVLGVKTGLSECLDSSSRDSMGTRQSSLMGVRDEGEREAMRGCGGQRGGRVYVWLCDRKIIRKCV